MTEHTHSRCVSVVRSTFLGWVSLPDLCVPILHVTAMPFQTEKQNETDLLDIHGFPHEVGRIQSGDGSIGLFASLHGHEPKPTGFTSVGVVHHGSLFDLNENKVS